MCTCRSASMTLDQASKTDPFRQGVSVVVGKTDNDICPVAGLAYMVSRGMVSRGSLQANLFNLLTVEVHQNGEISLVDSSMLDTASESGQLIKTMGR